MTEFSLQRGRVIWMIGWSLPAVSHARSLRGDVMGRGGIKTRDLALGLLRFEATDKARLVISLEAMLREFERKVTDLTQEIAAEEENTGVRNPASVGYSTFARATASRRATLLTSIEAIKSRLKFARHQHVAAVAELKRHLP
jgi:hypothetical protein